MAQLLAVLKNPTVLQMVINKGRHDSVYPGQPVLDGFGVLGQVIATYQTVSRVQFIADRRSAIPVQVKATGLRAILRGQGQMTLMRLINVQTPEQIKPGQILLTSGLGLQFPVGYPIGVVDSVKQGTSPASWKILVKPCAHLARSDQFLLVWPEQSKWVQSARLAIQKSAWMAGNELAS